MASILANTSISLVARAVSLLVGLVVTALLGRILGVEQFGQYALVLSFGAILHVVTDWGLYLTLTREIAREPARQPHILATTNGLRLAIFILVFFIGFALVKIVPAYTHLDVLYIVAAGGFLFQSLSQLLMGVFQAQGTVWKALIGDLTGRAVQLAVVIALIVGVIGGAADGLLVAMVAFALGAVVAYAVHATAAPQQSAWKASFEPRTWKHILRQSWPLGVMLILNAIYFRIDIIMISWFRPGFEVGWYGLAYRVVESGLFLPAAFGGLLLPKLAAASNTKRAGLVSQSLFSMLIAGAVVFILLAGAATPLVVLFAGQAFAPAGALLAILAAALVTMFFGNVFGFTLVALGRQRVLMYLYAGLAVFNIAANLAVIPRFGAAGAAWTTVITEAISTIVAAAVVYRYVPYKLGRRHVIAVLLTGGVSAVVLMYLLSVVPTLIAIAAALAVFGGCAAASKLLKRRHVTLLLEG